MAGHGDDSHGDGNASGLYKLAARDLTARRAVAGREQGGVDAHGQRPPAARSSPRR